MHFKLVLLMSFISGSLKAQHKTIEEKIIDKISQVKEVVDRTNYVQKASGGNRNLGITIYARPSKENPYFLVNVWEDNGINCVTHFNFHVYPKTLKIEYLDPLKGKPVSLEEWRQSKSKSN